jgi:isoquinoline 1-oxidoreductase beta subunit
VQVVWTREDDVRHGFYRPATHNRLAAGLDASGKPVAWTHHIVGPAILKFKFGELDKGIDRTLVEGAANVPYAIPNILVEQTVVETPVPIGFWRSVGSSHNAFVTEVFFDEIARAAKRDPYELRRELLKEQPRHLAALDLAADKAGWGKALPEGRFRGIAVAESFGSFVAEVAEISLGSNGVPRVHRVVVGVDCGPYVNPDTIVAQMESGVVYGLSAALYGEITLQSGRVQQSNFHDYQVLRMAEMPRVETYIVESTGKMGGIGEPGTPPIAPAVANAIHSGTGTPVRKLPIVSKTPAKTARG